MDFRRRQSIICERFTLIRKRNQRRREETVRSDESGVFESRVCIKSVQRGKGSFRNARNAISSLANANQRAKRRHEDVSSRIANERWSAFVTTHASEIRQKVEESPEDADFALAWKKMRSLRNSTSPRHNKKRHAAAHPIAQKKARVADACRAMLLDGLNAACGVSIST